MREEDQQQQHPRKLVISSSARKSYKRWLFLCGSAAVTLTLGEKKRHTWFSKSSVICYFLYIILYMRSNVDIENGRLLTLYTVRWQMVWSYEVKNLCSLVYDCDAPVTCWRWWWSLRNFPIFYFLCWCGFSVDLFPSSTPTTVPWFLNCLIME